MKEPGKCKFFKSQLFFPVQSECFSLIGGALTPFFWCFFLSLDFSEVAQEDKRYFMNKPTYGVRILKQLLRKPLQLGKSKQNKTS